MEENKVLQKEINTEENTVIEDSMAEIVTKKSKSDKKFAIDVISKVKTLKNEQPKKFFTLSGIVTIALALVIILGCVLIPMLSNTYKTPLDIELKYSNSRKPLTYFDECILATNGFAKSELEQILNILEKSDKFDEDKLLEYWEENIEYYTDEYGKNYKFKYKILEKEKLDREDLKDFKSNLKEEAEKIKDFVEEIDELDSDDIEEAADEMGLTRSEFKKLVKAYEDLADELKGAEISKGYELEVNYITTGSELDEPIENEYTINVYCINGRWVSENIFYSLYRFSSYCYY